MGLLFVPSSRTKPLLCSSTVEKATAAPEVSVICSYLNQVFLFIAAFLRVHLRTFYFLLFFFYPF